MGKFSTNPARRRAMLAGAALLSAIAVSAGAVAAKSIPWTGVVTTTPMGAHVLGNPSAPVRLVEYISYTCDHCAHFESESSATLKARYVANNRVAVEVRNLVRDPLDMTAATLARCGGPKAFFGHHNALMASQHQWLGKVRTLSEDRVNSWYSGALPARMQKIAADSGLDSIMQARGMTPVQIKACFANPVTQRRLEAMTNHARDKDNILGTPSFLFNGVLGPDIHDWASVKSRLDQMLGAT